MDIFNLRSLSSPVSTSSLCNQSSSKAFSESINTTKIPCSCADHQLFCSRAGTQNGRRRKPLTPGDFAQTIPLDCIRLRPSTRLTARHHMRPQIPSCPQTPAGLSRSTQIFLAAVRLTRTGLQGAFTRERCDRTCVFGFVKPGAVARIFGSNASFCVISDRYGLCGTFCVVHILKLLPHLAKRCSAKPCAAPL